MQIRLSLCCPYAENKDSFIFSEAIDLSDNFAVVLGRANFHYVIDAIKVKIIEKCNENFAENFMQLYESVDKFHMEICETLIECAINNAKFNENLLLEKSRGICRKYIEIMYGR